MAVSEQSTRYCLDLNQGWAFARTRKGRRWLSSVDGLADETVDLPHCWNCRDTFEAGVGYYRGSGSYRKEFHLDVGVVDQGEASWFIETGGFYGTGDVWLNGRRLGPVDGQYLGVRIEAGGFLRRSGANILAVRLNNRFHPWVLPGIRNPDFLLYGGLSGGLRLRRVPAVRLVSGCARICCGDVTAEECTVNIHYRVVNASSTPRRVMARWEVVEPGGVVVSETEQAKGAVGVCDGLEMPVARMVLKAPQLWSNSSPVLYTARCSLFEGTRLLDSAEIRFGCRTADFRPGMGFYLNGERVELRGCNRHESMPGFGNALPESLHREDAEAIRKCGLNFVRLSHYPQHPAFLDACDELGIMIHAEIATWKSVRSGRWLDSALRQMRGMIERDRNHPSVILWGMGNESRCRKAYIGLRDLANRLDPTRPVIYAENHLYRARRKKTVRIPDIWGLNYELDVLEEAREAGRLGSVVVTECSNYPFAARGDLEEELSQVRKLDSDLNVIVDRKFVAGYAMWCFNDYATLRKDRYGRRCGIVDAWRLPKMSAAYLEARYSERPFVRILGIWDKLSEERLRGIHVFSNCDSVEILLAGKSVRSLSGQIHYCEVIRFENGELEALGRLGGATVSDRLIPCGAPKRIELMAERCEVPADVGSTTGIGMRVLDECGVVVTSWSGGVRVAVEGPARLRTHRADREVPVSAGVGRTFLTSNGMPGEAVVTGEDGVLESGSTVVRFGA